MALRKNNTYHKLVAGQPAGADAEYTPDSLWEKALEYFQWVESNPLKEEKAFSSGKRIALNKTRAMTATGFCIFAHLSKDSFDRYSQTEEYKNVVSKIKDVIYTQKFEAAAAGLLETGFIARELGLREQTDITTNGKELNVEVVDKKTREQIENLKERLS
ncbi:MAG: terminase small subunit [Dysgonomonas sp.]|nr:terminase small subunit [Dysgonomonas sp.]